MFDSLMIFIIFWDFDGYSDAIKQEFRATPENEITANDFPDIETPVIMLEIQNDVI